MLLTKNGLIKSSREIRALYPDTSFSEGETFASLGWTEYVPPPPTQAELDAAVAFEAQRVADFAALEVVKANATVQFLRDSTPAQIETYIQANVTDLASARNMLKNFGVILCILAKRNLRG